MIQKILLNIFSGLKGILVNTYFTPKQKIYLIGDYVAFALLLIPVVLCKMKIHKVYIRTFGYTVYVHNFAAFFYIFNEIFCKSVYTPYTLRTYMDLGANIGLTILWYKFFNPDLEITAFEPDKYNYKIVLKNISINHLSKVTVYNVALCDKKGTMPFYTLLDDIQNLDSALTLNQNFPYKKYSVKTDKLSTYIKKPIDLIKMDIEGAEYQVLDDLFKSNAIYKIKSIIFESHYFNTLQEKLLPPVIRKLKKLGTIRSLKNSDATTIFHFVSTSYKSTRSVHF